MSMKMVLNSLRVVSFCLIKPQVCIHLKKLINPHEKIFFRSISTKPDVNKLQEKLSCKQRDRLEKVLRNYFELTIDDCDKMIQSNNFVQKLHSEHVQNSFDILDTFNVNKEVIKEHLTVLSFDHDVLKHKLQLLSKMNLKTLDHGIPFLRLSSKRLVRLYTTIKNEMAVVTDGNRLYFLSETMKVEPLEIAEGISKRLFIYTMPYENLQNSLKAMMALGVKPENILNDWWSLKYKPDTVKERLNQVKTTGQDKVMTWMIRCPESTLDKTINLRKTSLEILGDKNHTFNYIAERLNCPREMVNTMAVKIPAIQTVRISKVKDVIDYLHTKGYSDKEIIYVPRVLAHSLKTMQTRQELLEKAGNRPRNLNILCKSKKEFQKYLDSLQSPLLAKNT